MQLSRTYIIVDTVTSKGKYQVCKRMISGRYVQLAEARTQIAADAIVQALTNDEFTGKFTNIVRQAAE